MKKISQLLATILLLVFTLAGTNATYFTSSEQKIVVKNEISAGITIKLNSKTSRNLTLEEAFIGITDLLKAKDILNYSKIDLQIKGAQKGSKFYKSIQKIVSVGVLPNGNITLIAGKSISAYSFLRLSEKTYNINLIQANQIKSLKSRKATTTDLKLLKKALTPKNINNNVEKVISTINIRKSDSKALAEKKAIFNDVQNTLLNEHYDKNILTEIKLIEAATIGLTKGTGDKFTTYFPPTENKSFMESLDGKFEGIGSYVEMQEPGVMKIVTPISGSPSEKAGLKGGDQITHADGKEIIKTTSLQEAISWVKGPKGSTVILTIKRGRKILKISVIRDTIIIKNVEHKKINSSTYYIKLVTFGENISGDFKDALSAMKKQRGVKKIIIDLRNNPGGYLNEVSDMLSHFVPKGQETVIVKYLSGERNYYSRGYDLIDFSKYRIIILQNSGSASASEIMAGTIKDYLPKTTIIGEQSYGKGSVQSIKPYSDGSSLKYTVAKWFTGKTSTGIDGVGIPVDVELEFDFDRYQKNKYDNQLEKAKNIR